MNRLRPPAQDVAARPPLIAAHLTGVLAGLLAIGLGASVWAGLAVALSVYAFTTFLLDLGTGLPVDSLILLVAVLQWLVAPLLSYADLAPHAKYHMYVGEAEYLSLAVPGTAGLAIGLSLFRMRRALGKEPQVIVRATEVALRNHRLPLAMILVGGACSFVGGFAPPSLAFLFFLLSNVTYVGIIIALHSHRKARWWMLAGALSWMLLISIRSNMFHDFLLWTALIGLYIAARAQWSLLNRVLIVMTYALIVFVLHTAKIEIRQTLARSAGGGGSFEVFTTALNKTFLDEDGTVLEAGAVGSLIIRLNQGWIVSRVMEQVPAHRPFANGETIEKAVRAAFLPRFLDPDKIGAGGHALFSRFTSFDLNATSMGLSLLGEGYGNYGKAGAVLFLLIYGAAISLILRAYWLWAARHPIGIFWIPLLFLHTVKAETDFVVVLNYLVKALVVTIATVWYAERMLGAAPAPTGVARIVTGAKNGVRADLA